MAGDEDVESGSGPVKASERVVHITWHWYLTTMGTGGIAVVLGQQPHTFKGLRTIGKVVFIWDLLLFVVITGLIIQRFTRKSNIFYRSLRNPSEALFVPPLFLSIANIILCFQIYGVPSTGPWFVVTMRVLFWIYVAVTLLLAVFLYLDLFTSRAMTRPEVQPSWILPILPIMLSGTIAGSIASSQPLYYRMPILVAGITFQGLGFWTSISFSGSFLTRMMRIGLTPPSLRPGLFLGVAPPAFTALALINMSNSIPSTATYFIHHPTALETLQQAALAFGIFIWSVSLWWFSVALIAILMSIRQLSFHMVWYSMIFPNVGFTLATIAIGKGLYSNAILWVGSVMTILLVVTYLFLLVMHARALYRGDILWPGKDDDKDT